MSSDNRQIAAATASGGLGPMMQAFLDKTCECVIVINEENRLSYCNAAAHRLLSLSQDFIASEPHIAAAIKQPDLLEFLQRDVEQRNAYTASHLSGEITLNGGREVFQAQMTIIANLGRMVILHDISQLKAQEQSKTTFVKQVSQDIRTPLTSIFSCAELLSSAGEINERQQSFINRIIFSVQTITAILTDLLELDHVENAAGTHHVPTQLPIIARYAAESCQMRLKAKNLQLLTTLPEALPAIPGSPQHLRQMIEHLLENAISYTPEGGQIELTLEQQGGFLALTVRDSGIGIPVEEQPHIFEKLYRASNAHGHPKSTGLGLSIVKSIVEEHKGTIWVQSDGEGTGTAFTVLLPTVTHDSR